MDVVTQVWNYLQHWSDGGEAQCRDFLVARHCDPSDTHARDALATAYNTLITSLFYSSPKRSSLLPTAFVPFIQSILTGLPSSSQPTFPKSAHTIALGELLIDLVWSINCELDEAVLDAKALEDDATTGSAEGKEAVVKDKAILVDLLKQFLLEDIVSPRVCRERLDLHMLAAVELIPDAVIFEKKAVRTRTSLFFKQNKYNLLREQSEGYSKLIIEIAGSMGPPHSPETGLCLESRLDLGGRTKEVWQRVVSIIGYFDLDPNRALGIILDLFSVHVCSHSAFFLSLLSHTPWSDVLATPIRSATMVFHEYQGKTLDEILTEAEGSKSRSQGSRVLAQILGFKFTRDESPETTETPFGGLYLVTALLIRQNFLTLEDIYPHLSPLDEDMEAIRKQYLAKVDGRIAGAKNSLLAMAAPLESPAPSSSTKSRSNLPPNDETTIVDREPPKQKIRLLTALLAVGAMRPTLSIIISYPWLVDAYPEIADLLIRVVKETITPLYDKSFTANKKPDLAHPRGKSSTGGTPKAPLRRSELTLWAPTPPSTAAVDFVFFYPEWKDHLPVCISLRDISDVTEPLMRFIGLHVARDIVFLTKLLRLGRAELASVVPEKEPGKGPRVEDLDHAVPAFWFEMLRRYLLPALPLIRGNAVFAVEVWNLLRSYPISHRWRLYGEWKSVVYKSHPELRIRQVQADRESKGILRRLSHNTLDSLFGPVAKLAHSNPCILFVNAVNQVMAYDNLAEVVVLALRYVTSFGFDVLVHVILDALSNPSKARVKDDGVNISDWLQSLASFTGMLYRRYNVDLAPLLNYVVHQLHSRETTEVVVLRELIWKMAAIEPLPSLSDSQITAMSGGLYLRTEAVASHTRGARSDPNDGLHKAASRLGRALLDTNLALPLLIQVAQQRQECVFRTQDAHLKSVGSLFDTMHGVLLQYLELLSTPSILSADEYASKVVPSLAELGEKYGIAAPICMQIIRPKLQAELLATGTQALQEREKYLKAKVAQRQASAKGVAIEVGTPKAEDVAPDPGSIASSGDREDNTQDSTSASMSQTSQQSPWLPELFSVFDDVRKVAPVNAVEVIGPAFYLTFWQMSTYDLGVPVARYDEEVTALRSMSRTEDTKLREAERPASRAIRQSAAAYRSKRDRFNSIASSILEETKEHLAAQTFTNKRLAREKERWFPKQPNMKEATRLILAMIEHCFQPRCLLSPMDADYCTQLIKMLHKMGTPGFATIICYDKLLSDHIKVVVFSCSEYEARNYGRFLYGILTDLWKWHQDEKVWDQDNRITNKAGETLFYLPGFQRKWPVKVPDSVPPLTDFKQLLKKLHRKLGKCLIECIEAGDFMHVSNAIIVLKEILPVFPMAAVNEFIGAQLDMAIQRFVDTEERGDLKILGRAYAASLKKREPLWAVPKDIVAKTASGAPTKASTLMDKTRQVTDLKKIGANTPPSALSPNPRVQSMAHPPAATERPIQVSSTKLVLDNIPRPEVIKRVRDIKAAAFTVDNKISPPSDVRMDVDKPQLRVLEDSRDLIRDPNNHDPATHTTATNGLSGSPSNTEAQMRKELLAARDSSQPSTPGTPKDASRSGEAPHAELQQSMPPPVTPSQTASAQELRDTAKQTAHAQNGDVHISRALQRSGGNSSTPSSPRSHRRSASPRAVEGRSSSADSHESNSGRARSDRGVPEADLPDDRQFERRKGARSERDRLPRERTAREGLGEGEDKDRDRPRERHGERDHRDRERERDRDRHRRDEKERERESRKDRELPPRAPPVTVSHDAPLLDRALVGGPPDSARHHGGPSEDDNLGKRRRPVDDEPDRISKRGGSRREGGHREDKPRRASDREGRGDRPRDVDRRRKDRDAGDRDNTTDRSGDRSRGSEDPSKQSSSGPPPSAPRAMTSPRSSKFPSEPGRDRERAPRERDHRERDFGGVPAARPSTPSETRGNGNLRSRIGGDKESSLPLGRGSYGGSSSTGGGRRSGDMAGSAGRFREDAAGQDEGREVRKRTASERDKDNGAPSYRNSLDSPSQPHKRPRLNRDRYGESRGSTSGGDNAGYLKRTLSDLQGDDRQD